MELSNIFNFTIQGKLCIIRRDNDNSLSQKHLMNSMYKIVENLFLLGNKFFVYTLETFKIRTR